jgi:signal transduction histidine kinase
VNFFSVTLGVVAGICLGFGILYLFIGLRRKDNKQLNLTFSLFAFAYAGAILAAANNYAATLLTDYISAGRYNSPFVVIAWISLLWYVSFYTKVQPRPLLYLLMIAFIAAGVANILGPNLIYEDITGITILTLPWGEQLAIAEVTEGLWFTVFLLAQLISIGFILFACFRQYRRGEKQAAAVLGVGMLWFIITIVVDALVDTGAVDFIFLSDFGFLVLAIALSIQMANEGIKIDEELADYRQNLEKMVDERTSELETAQELLLQQERATATSDERNRLARDLHDAVTQTIYSAALIAEVLPAIWDRDSDQGRLNLTSFHCKIA